MPEEKKIGLVYDPIYLAHDTGDHVENAGRLTAIISSLEESGLINELELIKPHPATIYELGQVHEKQYIANVKLVAAQGGGWLDPDTFVSSLSYDAALYAAGGVLKATEEVMNGSVKSAFCAVRPPGHHATVDHAMGFCLFNNIAIAAKNALLKLKANRVAIIDFDVHHGNGTQDTFYGNPQALYVSTHESPFYPGTGNIDETGAGNGTGTTINIPLPSGCGDMEYRQVYEQIVIPAVTRFKPEFILVSAGYDAHWGDRIGLMKLTVSGYAWIAAAIRDLAASLCEGRLVFTLEGGYRIDALAASVKATIEAMQGKTDIRNPLGVPPGKPIPVDVSNIIERVKRIHSL